jgi:hypothetical protein
MSTRIGKKFRVQRLGCRCETQAKAWTLNCLFVMARKLQRGALQLLPFISFCRPLSSVSTALRLCRACSRDCFPSGREHCRRIDP